MTNCIVVKVTQVVLVLALLWAPISAQNHGAPCDDINPCDPDQFLECNPGTRQCVCATEGFFDGTRCTLRVRSPCELEPGNQQCVQNAVCEDSEGSGQTICTCKAGFVSNSDRRCYLPHAADCQHGAGLDQCDPVEFMQCGLDNKCECKDRTEAAYDSELKTCQLRTGARCGAGGLFPRQPCARHSSCDPHSNRCSCLSQFQPNKERLCFIPHGNSCNAPNECDQSSWQHCDRSCVCADPTNTFYDRETETCRKLVGTDCEPAPATTQPCVQNSFCSWDRRKCECDEGLDGDADKQCYLAYNVTCNQNQNLCNANMYMECSPVTGACGCKWPEEAAFDSRDRSCKLKAEAACSQLPGSQPCITDAACSTSEGPTPFRCKCQFNLEPNTDRMCHLTYGRRCDLTLDKCDPQSNLICDWLTNMCTCNQAMWFDEASRACKAYIGGSCRQDKDCVANANCHLEQCVCNEGFEDHGGVRCLKGYGVPCTDQGGGVGECSLESNLQCIGGICLCPAGHTPEGGSEGDGAQVKCVAGYQYPCNETISCSTEAGLACLGGKCDCLVPGEQIYMGGRCGSLVDNRCHLNTGNSTGPGMLHCTTNAECASDSGDPFMGRCQCKPGFRQTLSKTCVAASGAVRGLSVYSGLLFTGLIALYRNWD